EVVLRTKQLVKRFGSITAVDGLDVEVGRGEVVGLLGPNGAGKSTTIGMVLGLITPTAGTAEVLGRDIRVRREDALAGVGAMLEVTQVCDRVLVIKKGKLIASGTIAEVTRGGGNYFEIVVDDRPRAAEILRGLGITEIRETPTGLDVVADPKRGAEINRALASA